MSEKCSFALQRRLQAGLVTGTSDLHRCDAAVHVIEPVHLGIFDQVDHPLDRPAREAGAWFKAGADPFGVPRFGGNQDPCREKLLDERKRLV
jgi:hypothetical protein